MCRSAASGPPMVGLLRNDVQMMTSDIPGSLEHIRAGKLRALAHTGTTRMPQLPDLPTLAEAGVAGYEAAGFLGIMVRAGTPSEAVALLNREINNALASPEFSRHVANNGLGVGGGSPADFIEASATRPGDLVEGDRLRRHHRPVAAACVRRASVTTGGGRTATGTGRGIRTPAARTPKPRPRCARSAGGWPRPWRRAAFPEPWPALWPARPLWPG